MNQKYYMIILIAAEKACDKFQNLFVVKSFRKLEIEENFLNLIKRIYKNIILNGKGLNALLLILGRRQSYSFLSLLLNIVIEVLTHAIRQEKETKSIQMGKEDIKVSLLADMVICAEKSQGIYLKTVANK